MTLAEKTHSWGGFKVTVTARARHAALLEAARQFGSIKAFALHLGVSSQTLGHWINLDYFPNLNSAAGKGDGYRKRWPEIERKLVEATGQTIQQIFPEFVRVSGLLEEPKEIELSQEVNEQAMLDYRKDAIDTAPDPAREAERLDLCNLIPSALNTLSYRERTVVKLRYGLDDMDGHTFTYQEIGRILKITKERVRQIEQKALHKLQNPHQLDILFEAAESLVGARPCPGCGKPHVEVVACKDCSAIGCERCIVSTSLDHRYLGQLCSSCAKEATTAKLNGKPVPTLTQDSWCQGSP